MRISNLKTTWNFKIFKKINFKSERKKTLNNLENFYKKWKKYDLKKNKNLINFMKDYEKLISKPPGIFDYEYLYYLLKNLLDVKDKNIKKKLNEIEKLKNKNIKKIFSLLQPLKKVSPKERKKLLNHPLFKNYKYYLEFKIFKNIPNFYKLKNWFLLKIKISQEIKKFGEKIYENRHLQNKILKKYRHLGEKAFNEIFQRYYQLEQKYKLPFGYYEKYFSKEDYQRISKAIKKYVIKNKKLAQNLKEELKLKEKNLNDYLNSKISLNEAIYIIVKSFNKLNKNFGNIIVSHFQKGFVDVFPQKNKYIIPRNISISKFLPVFILINFDGTLKTLPQLIHEFGHVIHNEYLNKNKSPLNNPQSSISKEAVAYFFEFFVLENLKKTKNKHNKKIIDLWLKKIKLKLVFDNAILLLTINKAYKIYKKQKQINLNDIFKIYKKNLKIIFGKSENISEYEVLLKFYRGHLWFFPYLAGSFISYYFLKKFSKNKFLKLLKVDTNFLKNIKF